MANRHPSSLRWPAEIAWPPISAGSTASATRLIPRTRGDDEFVANDLYQRKSSAYERKLANEKRCTADAPRP